MSYAARAILATLLAASTGCLSLPALDEPNTFACKQDSDCLDGYGCVAGFCLKTGTTPVLSAPTEFSAEVGDGTIKLTWKNPTFADFSGVVIRRNTGAYPAGPSDGTQVYQGVGTYTTDSVANGSTLYYSIFAQDSQHHFSPPAQVSATANGPSVSGFTVEAYGRDAKVSWTGVTAGYIVVVRRDTSSYPTSSTGTPLSVPTGASSTWDSGLTPGQTYYYSAFAFSGTSYSGPALGQVALPYVIPPVRAPAGWNEWVRPDGTACTGNETGQNACSHVGEHRMFVLPGRQCNGLTAYDAKMDFDWVCANGTASDGTAEARFTSVGFRPGKGLADLVDVTSLTWFRNQVSVFDSTNAVVATSPWEAWWDNPISTLSVGTGALASGTVFVWNTLTSADLAISGATHVTILGATGGPLGGLAGSNSPVIGITGSQFVWLENLGVVPSTSNKSAIAIASTSFPVVRYVLASGANYGLALSSVSNGRLEHIAVNSAASSGLSLQSSRDNAVADVVVANAACAGIQLLTSDRNWLRDVRSNGSHGCTTGPSHGLVLDGSSNNVVTGLLASSNDGAGLYITGNPAAAQGNLVMTATVGNDRGPGLWITGPGAIGNTVLNIAALNDDVPSNGGIVLDGGSSRTFIGAAATNGVSITGANDNIFYSLLEVAGTNCTVTASSINPGIGNGCVQQSGSGTWIMTNAVFGSSIVGMVTADNTNPRGAMSPYEAILDWVDFDDPLREFGLAGASFPDPSDAGACYPGATCQVWDWRVSANDGLGGQAALLGVFDWLATPNWTQQVWAATDATACAAIAGAAWNASAGYCASQVAFRAIEQPSAIGNGNGICEQNELCLMTPNIGTYQGHGPLATTSVAPGFSAVRYTLNGVAP